MQSLRLVDIEKTYGDAKALRRASLEAEAGQVVAICGENGAGKSTLMSILAGSRQPTSGRIEIDGKPVTIDTPHRAFDLGIRTVYQELSLLPQLSVTENLFLGEMPVGRLGRIDWTEATRRAQAEMDALGMDKVNASKPVSDYPVATQQMVEIAKALRVRPEVLILDEPTGVLTSVESELLFAKIAELKAAGTIILYISHRLEEVLEISDVLIVLKDGTTVDRMTRAEADNDRLVTSMVGRPLETIYPERGSAGDRTLLNVTGFTSGNKFKDVNFELRSGEILGFCGLVGSGRTDVVRAIFGADPFDKGQIEIEGKPFPTPSPAKSIQAGIGFVTEERKHDGLALDADVLDNAGLASMKQVSKGIHLQRRKQRALVGDMATEMDVRPLKLSHMLRHMSGGNQQKVVLSKWLLLSGLKLLILDEPTRGVDIATKVQIYQLIAKLAAEGIGILLISSEMPELMGLSHRICVMRQGNLVAEFDPRNATEHEIFVAAADVSLDAA